MAEWKVQEELTKEELPACRAALGVSGLQGIHPKGSRVIWELTPAPVLQMQE